MGAAAGLCGSPKHEKRGGACMKIKSAGLDIETFKLILALAWPTMLEQLLSTAVQYVDTAMVGSLGTSATAAVGSTSTVNWLVGSTISAFGVGFLSYIAKSLGAGDTDSARRASAQSALAVLVCGTLFTVLTLSLSGVIPVLMRVDPAIRRDASLYFFIIYLPMLPRCASGIFGTVLRAAGDTKSPMKVGIAVNAVNVAMNFFLIYPTRVASIFGIEICIIGAGLGIIGAALATAISYTVGGIAITLILLRHKKISPIGYTLRPDREILSPCLKVALPNMLQRFTTSFGYVIFASLINALGEVATAAHTIANTVESAFYIPGYGMQTAAATLAGNALGAKDADKMKRLAKMFIPIEITLMVISGAALFVSAPALVGIFSESPEVIALGTTVLRMVAVSEPIYGFSIIIEGFMHGVGKTKLPFIFNVIGMWGVRILGTFIATVIFSGTLVAAWGCMIIHNASVFVMYLVTYIKGLWNPLNSARTGTNL